MMKQNHMFEVSDISSSVVHRVTGIYVCVCGNCRVSAVHSGLVNMLFLAVVIV
jgi:hypothetical protein